MYKFRTLKSNEIECRVSRVSSKGVVLLLYKNARVDINLLNEVVGSTNWQRRHTRDNANCIVSLWDDEKKQWVEKEDTGSPSVAEKDKGLASDSFKRSCVNWGIGVELYTAPPIWISADKCNITPKGEGYVCYDKFHVVEIGYDDERNINHLVIALEDGTVVFRMLPKTDQADQKVEKVNTLQVKILNDKFSEIRENIPKMLANYNVSKIEDMTVEQFCDAIKKLNEWELKKQESVAS